MTLAHRCGSKPVLKIIRHSDGHSLPPCNTFNRFDLPAWGSGNVMQVAASQPGLQLDAGIASNSSGDRCRNPTFAVMKDELQSRTNRNCAAIIALSVSSRIILSQS